MTNILSLIILFGITGASVDVDGSIRGTTVDRFKAEARTQNLRLFCTGRFNFVNVETQLSSTLGVTVTGRGQFDLNIQKVSC